MPDGIAISRCRFFLAGGDDFFPQIRIAFEEFEFREEFLRGCDFQIIHPVGAFGLAGAVLPGQEGNTGNPGIVKFGGRFVEVAGFGKIADSQNRIDIRVVVPAIRSAKG